MASDGSPVVRVGTAGWSLPRAVQEQFAGDGSHLARYSRVFPGAEINSSFHRPHKPGIYARWAEATPESFRFSVKIPKAVTHVAKLVEPALLLDAFFGEATALGSRLDCLLVQLPPSLQLDERTARAFFATLRERWRGDVAIEPRHATWFTQDAAAMLGEFRVARVAADPVRAEGGDAPAGWSELAYYRVHGSPRTYYSSYDAEYLRALAKRLVGHRRDGARVWCIFDNTASGAAAGNALDLMRLIEAAQP